MNDLVLWFKDLFTSIVSWFEDIVILILSFFKDIFLNVFELALDGVVYVFLLLEPPQLLTNGLDTAFSALGNDLLYFLSQSGLAAGLAIYGSGVSFRLLRKLFTLGQW
tara:strand:- start:3146 stop:3469 length:324 start_codon:yes stop_codon:yes gene_type:complete